MFTLKIKNNRGEIYELTHNRRQYSILDITGLTLPQCNVNMISSAGQDGGEYSSSHLNPRNIVITLALEGDIETNRQLLYTIFPPHSPVTVYYQTFNRDLYIDGYLESIDGSLFAQRETMQISIICPDPYFRGVHPVTAETADGSCVIRNNGDTAIGFVAEVTVTTNDAPTLTLESEKSASPTELQAREALLSWVGFETLDMSHDTLNILLNNKLRDPSEYTAELVVNPSGGHILWLRFPNASLVNAQIGAEIIKVDGMNLTDMRYWVSSSFIQNMWVTIDGVPSWFDQDKDCIVFAYIEGAVGRIIPTAMTATRKDDGTYSLSVTFPETVFTNRIELRLFHSMGGTDVSTATITRDTAVWRLGAYTPYFTSPDMPPYDDSKDILRIYLGDKLLEDTDYYFKTYTRSDSSALTIFFMADGKVINDYITFEVISSVSGTDIRSYTQEQIDEGLCIVDGLTLTNTTSGESLVFRDAQFRSGDKIEISTVQGDLHAIVKESTWLTPGQSLVRDLLKNGSFFKLVQGKNTLTLTAATNADYASATFSARQLYGGV
jgi:hypothetical protein